MKTGKTEIIAHRGFPQIKNENTIDSFSRAVDAKADLIEFDVRRTKDGTLVVHHDPHIFQNFKRYDLKDITSAQLQVIAEQQGFQVPTVEDVLKKFGGIIGFDIELKETGCEQETIEMCIEFAQNSKYFFTSFIPEVLNSLKSLKKDIITGFLFDKHEHITTINKLSTDILCPKDTLYFKHSEEFGKLHDQYEIAVWTVDDRLKLRHLLEDQNIDAIITNRTDIAVEERDFFKINHTVLY
jgi:glycerophosphoryl diester phosphodiesterase